MRISTRYAAAMAMAVLAVALGGCGSKESASATTADVTFNSEPIAEVWVDGKASGTTPVMVTLDAGSHEVALKAEGFTSVKQTIDVEAGKDITIDGALQVEGDDEAAYARLIAALGQKHEKFAEAKLHRGHARGVSLYYPSMDVRRNGLSTYRIEVDASYDYDGYIVFRDGKNILFREKFEPETTVTERSIPAEVMEYAKAGKKFQWGLEFDKKARKKNVTTKVKLLSKSRERKFDRALAKNRDRKVVRSQTALMREMADIDVLKRYRLYSEMMKNSLTVLNTWPDTMLPYRGMVDAMHRLKLKESPLYSFAAAKVAGHGVKGPGSRKMHKGREGSGTENRGDRNLGGVGPSGLGGQRLLPPTAIAPTSKAAKDGLKAGGGMSVSPTSQAKKSADATPAGGSGNTGNDSSSATGGDPRQRDWTMQAEKLQEQLTEQEKVVAEAEEALKQMNDAKQAWDKQKDDLKQMKSALDAAKQAVQDAINQNKPQSQIDALKKKVQDAQTSYDQEVAKEHQLEKAYQDAENAGRDTLNRTGSVDDAKQQADQIRNQLEEAQQNARDAGGTPGTGTPGTGTPGTGTPSTGTPGTGTPGTGTPPGFQDPNNPSSNNDAKIRDRQIAAAKAAESAQSALQAANAALKQAQQSGTPDDIRKATQAQAAAAEAHTKAQEDLDRANQDVDRALLNNPNTGDTRENFIAGLRQTVTDAQSQADIAKNGQDAAAQAAQNAQNALLAANNALQQAQQGGNATDIANAKKAQAAAAQANTRAQMDLERANADVDRTVQNLKDAQDNLVKAENDNP